MEQQSIVLDAKAIPVLPQNGKPDALLTMIERVIMSPDFDIARLHQLLELKERYEKDEARKAFVAAMSAFKANAIRVVKDKVNTQYQSRYVSLGNLVGTVTPFLSQHGLSIRWDIDQASGIKVTCIVTHAMGHFESVSMVCPPDKSGAKNPIQEIKSAITYAKACTFESICGLASSDANLDNDGNSTAANGLPEEKLVERLDWIGNARNDDELKRFFRSAYEDAEAAKDKSAQTAFIKAKNNRYRDLHKGGAQ